MLQNGEKEEEKLPIGKGSEVEVCSEEEGFVGAWFRAILEECPTKSRRKKLRVRYTTLLQEDFSTPLTETVQRNFIRPVPPEDLYEGVFFVEGSVVDADLRDGWWHGVVVKKLEDDLFLVCFDTPPDILQFNRKQLRPHLDWTGSEWIRPKNKELSNSLFSSGTMIEVSRVINKLESAWFPAIVIKELEVDDEKKIIVKSCYKSLIFNADEVNSNFPVDVCKVRPVPPPSFVEEYSLLAPVDAFRGFAWRRCLVRGILTDKRYTVSFLATKEEYVFRHSELRPSKEWEDGVWHELPKRKLEKETPSDGQKKRLVSEINVLSRLKKLKVIRSCAATKPITRAGGSVTVTPKSTDKHIRKSPVHEEATQLHEAVAVKESGSQMADGVMNGAATPVIITTKVIPIGNHDLLKLQEKESAPPVTSDINVRPLSEQEAETQGKATPKETIQPMRMKNGLGIDSTGEKSILFMQTSEEHNNKGNRHRRKRKHDSNLKEKEALIADTSDNDDYDQPLSAWILGGKSSNDSDKSTLMYPPEISPNGTPNAVKKTAPRASEDTTMALPFVKRLPIWKTLESMEIFKTAKQSPHFMPLLHKREELREGLAVGEMAIFSSLLERVRDVQLHTPKSTLEGLKECFYEREKYGFDVSAPISRINMLVSLIDENVSTEVKLKEIEKGRTEEVSKVQKIKEDLRDVEAKILELHKEKSVLKVKEDASEKKIDHMQQCAEDLDKKLQEAELEFQKIVSASW